MVWGLSTDFGHLLMKAHALTSHRRHGSGCGNRFWVLAIESPCAHGPSPSWGGPGHRFWVLPHEVPRLAPWRLTCIPKNRPQPMPPFGRQETIPKKQSFP